MTKKEEQIAYENLVNASIVMAVRDYQKAYMAHLRDPLSKERLDKVEHLRRFFRSDWYHTLTKVDSEFLMRTTEKQCEEKRACAL